ncbi:MAG: type II toxin-antitoxin system VapC family toxin [Deltaproteobacteria bacterium]|nr:type II toxin-antitoxin system VapC family toxin [Deltaproteobacteria bacterium]
MRLLVDTHVLLWAIAEPQKLPGTSQAKLEAAENEVLFSAASIWELAIKLQIGRLVLPIGLEDLMDAAKIMGFTELPVSAAHAAGVWHLPLYHRDPFDRLLVAQAIHEPARLLTADRALSQYSNLVEVIV